MQIVTRLNQERGTTVVYVTHDPRMARFATRLIEIQDGRLVSDRPNERNLAAGEADEAA
jgi:ABC-type lipoprotein export system ATPase subunit